MKDYSVQYSDEALHDLRSIFSYLANERRERSIAQAQVRRIRDAIRSLDSFPKKFRTVDWEPWASMGMHQMAVDRYIVFYLVTEDRKAVSIVRIFYGGRDIPNIVAKTSH